MRRSLAFIWIRLHSRGRIGKFHIRHMSRCDFVNVNVNVNLDPLGHRYTTHRVSWGTMLQLYVVISGYALWEDGARARCARGVPRLSRG